MNLGKALQSEHSTTDKRLMSDIDICHLKLSPWRYYSENMSRCQNNGHMWVAREIFLLSSAGKTLPCWLFDLVVHFVNMI